MTSRSPWFAMAIEQRRIARAEFQDFLENHLRAADDELSGYLLNQRGTDAGIEAMTLFYGPAVRVKAYASEELVNWFQENGRMTFQEYEESRFQSEE